jgi:hypothetical protein
VEWALGSAYGQVRRQKKIDIEECYFIFPMTQREGGGVGGGVGQNQLMIVAKGSTRRSVESPFLSFAIAWPKRIAITIATLAYKKLSMAWVTCLVRRKPIGQSSDITVPSVRR